MVDSLLTEQLAEACVCEDKRFVNKNWKREEMAKT